MSLPSWMPRPSLLLQMSRFSVVGVINTGVDLAILNVATLLTGATGGAGYAAQKALSFCVAAACSFLLNKRWTFQDTSRTAQKKLAQFLGISLVGALLNVSVATTVVTYARPLIELRLGAIGATDQLWVNVGALCGAVVSLLWNFLGYKRVVFRS